jgi:hypothetical protein
MPHVPCQRYQFCKPNKYSALLYFSWTSFLFFRCFLFLFWSTLSQGHLSLISRPPLPEEGPLVAEIASSDLEAPETVESRGEEEVKNSSEGTGSTQSPPCWFCRPRRREEEKVPGGREFLGYIQRCTPRPPNFFKATSIFVFHARLWFVSLCAFTVQLLLSWYDHYILLFNLSDLSSARRLSRRKLRFEITKSLNTWWVQIDLYHRHFREPSTTTEWASSDASACHR